MAARQVVVRLVVAALVTLTVLWGRGQRPQPGVFVPHAEGEKAPGELIVSFRRPLSAPERDAILAPLGASVKREMLLDGYATVSVPAGQEEDVGRRLAQSAAVRTVEENGLRFPLFVPNDEFYSVQWNMTMIQMEQAWEVNRGGGVVVAVVDTGVAYEDYLDGETQFGRAPDLAGTQFVSPYDMYSNDPHANDDFGHGTHVAGTIAQTTNNGIGVAGIAFEASVMPVKVCGNDPTRTPKYGCPQDHIADGVKWAVDHGARVINLSIGGGGGLTQAEQDALNLAQDRGVVVIAAAGNSGTDRLDYPAAFPSVIAVGAVGKDQILASYSSYGTGDPGHQLDLVAPGGDTDPEGSNWIYQNSYLHFCPPNPTTPESFTNFVYCPYRGTSMAAAHVSGVAALVLSKFPSLSPDQVRTVLTCSALDLGPPGVDLQYGSGLVQAYNALRDDDGDGVPNCLDAVFNTPTPTPSPPPDLCAAGELTPTATPTEAPSPTASPGETGSPTPTPTPAPSRTPLPSDTVSVTDTPAPTPTDTPTPTPTASPTDTPALSPTGSATPGLTPSASPSPTPSPEPATPAPTPTPTLTPTPTAAVFGCGDVDCSGAIDSADALWVLRYIAGLQPSATCIGRAYVDCDSKISVADALVILRYVAGLRLSVPDGCAGPG